MDDIDLLAVAVDRTHAILGGIGADHRDRPTPCDEYDVGALCDHVVGWLQMFEAWTNGRLWEGDAESYVAVDAPAEFRALADSAVAGWREHGTDRMIEGMNATLPAEFVLSMMMSEYVVHGWDLAVATDQEPGYPDELLRRVLARGTTMLTPEHRGPGKAFGFEVEVPADAPLIDRVVAWAGRDPSAIR